MFASVFTPAVQCVYTRSRLRRVGGQSECKCILKSQTLDIIKSGHCMNGDCYELGFEPTLRFLQSQILICAVCYKSPSDETIITIYTEVHCVHAQRSLMYVYMYQNSCIPYMSEFSGLSLW